ncbi:MAG: LysR family transcriptional regulator, partial [Comamonadaceae bacterium]
IQTIALGMLPRAIKRFSMEHPDVGLSIHTGHSSTIAQWVDARFCDMGIVSLLSPQNYSSEPEEIYRTDGVCMMHASHRLARNDVITPQDLEGEAFISLSRQDELRNPVDRIFEEAGVTRRLNIETPYSSIICSLVALDMGVCIMNPLVAQDYRHAQLVSRPFRPSIAYTGMVIVPKGRPLSRLAARFREVLRDVAMEECMALPKY